MIMNTKIKNHSICISVVIFHGMFLLITKIMRKSGASMLMSKNMGIWTISNIMSTKLKTVIWALKIMHNLIRIIMKKNIMD